MCGLLDLILMLPCHLGYFRFQVGVVEEIREKYEVAGIHEETVAEVFIGLLAVVTLFLVLVDQDIDGNANRHLGYLQCCDDHGYPLGDVETESFETVVGVHEGVHGVVHHHEPSAWGGVVCVAVPDVDHDSDVVVPVKKYQGLLPQDNEHSVPQFIGLGDGEQVSPDGCGAIEVGRVAH